MSPPPVWPLGCVESGAGRQPRPPGTEPGAYRLLTGGFDDRAQPLDRRRASLRQRRAG